jgi:hypothetical protein
MLDGATPYPRPYSALPVGTRLYAKVLIVRRQTESPKHHYGLKLLPAFWSTGSGSLFTSNPVSCIEDAALRTGPNSP